MSEAPRAWTRPHDWVEVLLGVLIALSPLVFDTKTAATWTVVVLGVLIVIDGLSSLAMPGMVYGEAVSMVLGALLFISPWVIDYTAMSGLSWTSWIGGALTIVVGAAALPVANQAHARSGMAGQH